jgi:hypothetical protein
MNFSALEVVGFLVGASLVICLLTLVGCLVLIPRLKFRPDRLLVGVIMVLCFSHGLRLLQDTGFWPAPVATRLIPVAGFCTAVLFFMSLVILAFYTAEHRRVKYALRLAQANEAPPPPAGLRSGSGIHKTPLPGVPLGAHAVPLPIDTTR